MAVDVGMAVRVGFAVRVGPGVAVTDSVGVASGLGLAGVLGEIPTTLRLSPAGERVAVASAAASVRIAGVVLA